jgi:hypothetical protein
MNMQKQILNTCFTSPSSVWTDFINSKGELDTLYYPSAGLELQPFIYSKAEFLRNESRLKFRQDNYQEPNFFVFSDYFP